MEPSVCQLFAPVLSDIMPRCMHTTVSCLHEYFLPHAQMCAHGVGWAGGVGLVFKQKARDLIRECLRKAVLTITVYGAIVAICSEKYPTKIFDLSFDFEALIQLRLIL